MVSCEQRSVYNKVYVSGRSVGRSLVLLYSLMRFSPSAPLPSHSISSFLPGSSQFVFGISYPAYLPTYLPVPPHFVNLLIYLRARSLSIHSRGSRSITLSAHNVPVYHYLITHHHSVGVTSTSVASCGVLRKVSYTLCY